MANSRNPNGNSIVQALIDLEDRGFGTMKVGDLITKINNDPKLRTSLQAAWDAHAYPEKSMVYTQLGIDQRLFTLTDTAYKVVTCMGMYCHQNGLIQIKIDDLSKAIGIGRTSAKQALAELKGCGAIRLAIPSARHEAPVYAVNPVLVNKGKRRVADAQDFTDKLSIKPDDYLLHREPELVIQTDVIRTSNTAYTRLYLISAAQAAETKQRTARKKKPADKQIPGQMSIVDFPEVINE